MNRESPVIPLLCISTGSSFGISPESITFYYILKIGPQVLNIYKYFDITKLTHTICLHPSISCL